MENKTETIHARVEPKIKHAAGDVLSELGLSMTDAIRLFLRQVVLHRGLPFDVRVPNETTVATLRKTDAEQDLHSAEDDEDLFKQLGI